MRGLRNNKTAKLLLDGWVAYYNFLRPHETLKGKTPAEMAGIKFPYKHWADVIRSKQEVTIIPEKEKYPPDKTYRVRAYPVPEKPKHKSKPHKPKREATPTVAIATSKVKQGEK
jgi:hypothetical protein